VSVEGDDGAVLVLWDESLLGYDFGSAHPLAPVRVDLTMRLARELGVLDRPGVRLASPPTASDEVLQRVHTPAYVAAVRRSAASGRADLRHGLGTSDNPVFPDMHDVTARVVGGGVAGAEAVWRGEARHAVNITGGLHHAMSDAASGFCVYNDVAVAIATLLEAGAERVAYIDVDVHHGDGVERAFWDDPRVLTISLHESGRTLFPGTGAATDVGGPSARGFAVNVALPAAPVTRAGTGRSRPSCRRWWRASPRRCW
jgi:acetoin utilization protein AcuC